jgi:hypothetical protein
LNGEDVTEVWDNLLKAGLPKGILSQTGIRHPSFNLEAKIEQYIETNLSRVVDDAINNF